ncbi:MAG: CapA family protein [Treponema sp.]|jgi:poly-gamma-glutamate synthesis protein (capsule biosynthesis protein)|nr:CapA family protein [Treponema sp.]
MCVLFFLLLSACKEEPAVDNLTLDSAEYKDIPAGGVEGRDAALHAETAFLLSLLGREILQDLGLSMPAADEAAEIPTEAGVRIELASYWGSGEPSEGIVISRVWYVPASDPLERRVETSLDACISGSEALIPLQTLSPPLLALKVDGLSAEEESYPLVRTVSCRVRQEIPPPGSRGSGGKKIGAGALKKIRGRIAEKAARLEDFLAGAPKPLIEEKPRILWVCSGGDLMLDRGASGILLREGPEGILGGTAACILQADLALVNLEGAVSSRGVKTPKSFNFRFDPQVVPALRDAGIDAVLLANNHSFDYGETAFLDTLQNLKDGGIGILGAGLNDDEASKPFLFENEAGSARCFGIASFPREWNGWDGLSVAARSDKAGILHAGKGGGEKIKAQFRADDTLDIVLFHGGVEWSTSPSASTREFYTELAEAGADLIVGSHPHVVQGFEWLAGKPVFWSLGNYVFGGMENTIGGEEGLFIRLGFRGKSLVYLEPYALSLTHTKTDVAPRENLETFYTRSGELR